MEYSNLAWVIIAITGVATVLFLYFESKKTAKILQTKQKTYESTKFNSEILANRKENKGVKKEERCYVRNSENMLSSQSFVEILNATPKCSNR